MKYINRIPVFGEPDEGAMQQIERTSLAAQHVALMADHHLGYGVPIGGVAAYVDAISPTGVGGDIACGNMAARLDMKVPDFERPWRRTPGTASWGISSAMDLIFENISFGIGRRNAEPVDHALFDDAAWQVRAYRALRDKAAGQLGTIGGGNHYVDLFSDENGDVWVGVHFGSRGLGYGIHQHVLDMTGTKDGTHIEPLVLSVHSALGEEYLAGMQLAGRYAYAGREWVVRKVAQLLGARVMETVHNNHNFGWKERHVIDGAEMDVWVVRKGATPAFPGQLGFVGGSMGDQSVILRGRDNATIVNASMQEPHAMEVAAAEDAAWFGLKTQQAALFSTVHGAGRVLGRKRAAGLVKRRWVLKPETEATLAGLRMVVRNHPKGSKQRQALRQEIQRLETRGAREHGYFEEEVVRNPEVDADEVQAWLARERVVLRGGDLEEAPQCYRRLPDVLREHEGTIDVLHTLRPLGVAMAGPDIRDPYKD